MLTPEKRPNTPFWIARGTIKGRRVERSTGETSLARAKAKIPEITARILAEIAAEVTDWREMPFSTAMAAYVDNGGEKRFLSRLLEHFQETKLGAIDNPAMARAAASIYPAAAAATIRRQLYVPMWAILNFAKDDKLRAPKGGNQRTVFFTPEQAEALIRQMTTQPSPYLAALATFWIGQGPRAGETFGLDGRDVNLAAGYAILRDTKNGEERRVDLVPRVIAALSRLPTIGKPGPVFRRADGRVFAKRERRGGQVRNPFAYAVEKIGLDPRQFTPHVCRHTFATWHYAVHKDPLALKLAGGWKSNEWQRYVKLAPPGLAPSVLAHGWFSGENRGKPEATPMKSSA